MKIVSVVKARIQTVEDIYCLVWTAVANRRPIGAGYHGFPRLFCPRDGGSEKRGQFGAEVAPSKDGNSIRAFPSSQQVFLRTARSSQGRAVVGRGEANP